MSIKKKYKVEPLDNEQAKEWLLKKHYLKRKVSISYCFGLFNSENVLQGVCGFGNAVPITMKKSICGEKYMNDVYELNRLCINEGLESNVLSFFLSKCFSLLPRPMIIVSYADKSVGHQGYIYQATNFIYTGLSHTQKDWKVKGKEHLHLRTLLDEFAFEKNRVKKLKEKYGDLVYSVMREAKHRYIYFVGNKKQVQNYMSSKLFESMPYPKGENTRYDASYKPTIQTKLF